MRSQFTEPTIRSQYQLLRWLPIHS
jgi:hypothetical protein